MRFPKRELSTLLLLLVGTGCVILRHPETPISTPSPVTRDALREANRHPAEILRLFHSSCCLGGDRQVIDTVPVGTIMPFIPGELLNLPETWRYCNGDVVDDPDSPLHGMALPDLTRDVFLAGTLDAGTSGGNNRLPSSGQHSHGGATGAPNLNGPSPKIEGTNDGRLRVVAPNHAHGLPSDGIHDHGGDRRPKWHGVLYIVKIKE